jgi:hypothetical protein
MNKRYTALIFKSVFIILAVLAPLNFALADTTPPEQGQNVKALVASTQVIPTEVGPAYMDVQSFDISTAADLAAVKQQFLQQLHESKSRHLFQLHVTGADHLPTALDVAALTAVNEIAAEVKADRTSPQQNIQVETPPTGFFKKNYNLTLALVRFVANTGVVSVGLILGKHIPMEHALMIGTLAGSMSAGIQLKSEAIFKWLNNSVILVNSAKRMGLIKSNSGEDPTHAAKVIREVEMYGRWAMLEVAFLTVVQTSMHLLNIPVTENLLMTVGKSVASQGFYELGILKLANSLEQINPNWKDRTGVFKNVAMFAGSGISVLSAVGSLIGMPYANLGFVALTATGLVFHMAPKIMTSKSIEKILATWRPRARLQCASLPL